MTIEQLATLATFGSTWAVLAVGHNVADHVFGQSDHQAANKGAPTAEDVAAGASPRRGRAACLAHVGQYHLVMGALFALVWLLIPLPLSVTGGGRRVRVVGGHPCRAGPALAGALAVAAHRLAGLRRAADVRTQRDVFGGLLPTDVHRPQHPEPAQQIEGVAPARQRTHVPQQPIPQVGADRLDLPARHVHHQPRQHGRGTGDHRPGTRQPYPTLHQIPMNTGDLMRQRHAQSLQNGSPRVEPINELVQSTDPALHRAIGIGAAAVTTWLTTRPGGRR
ncbi:hypothetical protein [Streptomyces sp. GS7]|uniref:hypothetical protein n=1 Tax=Streptomyces sp. GS7 TaxID=2692234 RepID=UPI001915AFE3|nr:hypothetical protein [Streptomyces sp. GS7]